MNRIGRVNITSTQTFRESPGNLPCRCICDGIGASFNCSSSFVGLFALSSWKRGCPPVACNTFVSPSGTSTVTVSVLNMARATEATQWIFKKCGGWVRVQTSSWLKYMRKHMGNCIELSWSYPGNTTYMESTMELTWNCHLLLVLDIYTLPETNNAPENWWLED